MADAKKVVKFVWKHSSNEGERVRAVLHASVVYANLSDHYEMLTWRKTSRQAICSLMSASVGSSAIWAADLGAEVIALEPADDTFALLEESVALNGYPIKTIRAAARATRPPPGSLVGGTARTAWIQR